MPAQLTVEKSSAPTQRSWTECRVYERLACELPALLQPTADWGKKESQWPATIGDISVGGVRIQLGRRYEPGTNLAIELPGHDGEESYTVLAKVVHVKTQGGGRWTLGCKFSSVMSDDELQRLVRPVTPDVGANEAKQAVEPVVPSRVLEAPAAPNSGDKPENKTIQSVHFQLSYEQTPIMDCIILKLNPPRVWPPAPGTNLTMFGNTSNGSLPMFKLQIVQCSQKGAGWKIQCKLNKPPSAEMMAALRQLEQSHEAVPA